MPYLGSAKTPEGFVKEFPDHPFARPAITFVPKRRGLAPPKALRASYSHEPLLP